MSEPNLHLINLILTLEVTWEASSKEESLRLSIRKQLIKIFNQYGYDLVLNLKQMTILELGLSDFTLPLY